MIRFNEARYQQMIGSPTGPVGRHLGRVGARVESAAKLLITQEKLVRSGRYRASIAWRLVVDGKGLVVQVGSALPIARLIERGSPAHVILPRNVVDRAIGNFTTGREALWWTHGGDRGWLVPERPLARVQHPGTRPYMVLHRAVRLVLKGV